MDHIHSLVDHIHSLVDQDDIRAMDNILIDLEKSLNSATPQTYAIMAYLIAKWNEIKNNYRVQTDMD